VGSIAAGGEREKMALQGHRIYYSGCWFCLNQAKQLLVAGENFAAGIFKVGRVQYRFSSIGEKTNFQSVDQLIDGAASVSNVGITTSAKSVGIPLENPFSAISPAENYCRQPIHDADSGLNRAKCGENAERRNRNSFREIGLPQQKHCSGDCRDRAKIRTRRNR
jgi:hypothetical protein